MADKKLHDLTEITAPSTTDELYLLHNPTTTPVDRRIQVANLLGQVSTVVKAISQSAHGLAVGNIVRYSGTAYVKAKADSVANAASVGIVSAVADADNFTLTPFGYVTGLTGLVAGTLYYLDPVTAGAVTSTEPSTVGLVSKPVLVADSTTSGWFTNWRGNLIATQTSAGSIGGLLYLASSTI